MDRVFLDPGCFSGGAVSVTGPERRHLADVLRIHAGHDLTLAIAPPRGGRMEIAIEKTVECGLGRIVPLDTSRSVLKGRDESARADRWRRVARLWIELETEPPLNSAT